MALSMYFVKEKITQELLAYETEIKEGVDYEEALLKCLNNMTNILLDYRKKSFKQLLLNMYDGKSEKLKADLARLTLMDGWGGDKIKGLAVVYPTIKQMDERFKIGTEEE